MRDFEVTAARKSCNLGSATLFPNLKFAVFLLMRILDNTSEDIFIIGVSDHITEGIWKTTESDHKCDVQFTNWRAGQPNNFGGDQHCVAMRKSQNWKWHDIPCSLRTHFLCLI